MTVNYQLITEKITPFETIKIQKTYHYRFQKKISEKYKKKYRKKYQLIKKKSWVLGMKCFEEIPYEIIRELSRSLKTLNWRWYKISYFNLMLNLSYSVSWPYLYSLGENLPIFGSLNIVVQLFLLKSELVLDFCRLGGDMGSFLNSFLILTDEINFG